LVLVGDPSELPFDGVDEWWRRENPPCDKPIHHLWRLLGQSGAGESCAHGKGKVLVLSLPSGNLALDPEAEERYLHLVRGSVSPVEQPLLLVRRGPYLAGCALPESPLGAAELRLDGDFIDLFDASLTTITNPVLKPGEAGLFYDLSRSPAAPAVIACAGRVEKTDWDGALFEMEVACPSQVGGMCVCRLPSRPRAITVNGRPVRDWTWDEPRSLLRVPYSRPGSTGRYAVRIG
jgi:hypothetical protein